MLKFNDRPKTPGITVKTSWLSRKEISYLQVMKYETNLDETSADMVQFTKNGTGKIF